MQNFPFGNHETVKTARNFLMTLPFMITFMTFGGGQKTCCPPPFRGLGGPWPDSPPGSASNGQSPLVQHQPAALSGQPCTPCSADNTRDTPLHSADDTRNQFCQGRETHGCRLTERKSHGTTARIGAAPFPAGFAH